MTVSILPDVLYSISDSFTNPKLYFAKNLWRRNNILAEFKNKLNLFDEYIIVNAERPDIIAHNIYQNSFYDWTILIANDIVNFHEQWPKSQETLKEYVLNKYDNPYAIKQYETYEVRNSSDELIVPEGLVVPQTYNVSYYDNGSFVSLNPTKSISYFDYEVRLNEEKEKIQIIRPEYIEAFVEAYQVSLTRATGTVIGVNPVNISM
jgi:hypothetical protein